MKDYEYALGLSAYGKFSNRKIVKFVNYFGNFERVWTCFDTGFFLKFGVPENKSLDFFQFKRSFNIENYIEVLSSRKIKYAVYSQNNYPDNLKEIYDYPIVVYFKGNLDLVKESCVGVVGTRRASEYGKNVLHNLIPKIVDHNLIVVSGLALGIDSLAHKCCLESGGKTIAVLAGSVDQIYPRFNYRLADNILENDGLIISELGPDSMMNKYLFPARNRIISGLSRGIVVIEAPKKSGALITARYALEQNRSVMAIPGDIGKENNAGSHNLIKQGAVLVDCIDDIISELGYTTAKMEVPGKKYYDVEKFSVIEKMIYNLLSKEDLHIDSIIGVLEFESDEIIKTINLMVLNGYLIQLENGMFSLNLC